VGNVLGINTESYSYDSLNRLTYSSGPWGILKYGYDGVGNRLWALVGGTNTTYTYGLYDRLSSAGSTSNTYDNNGSLKTQTTGPITTTYSYDFENRLTKVGQGGSTLGAYAYSAKGQRIEKTEGGVTTVYENQGVNVLWEDPLAGVASDYVYAAGLLIAKSTSGNIFYFHQDKQGSTRLVTTGSTTSFSTNYQPFGPQYGATGTDPTYKYTEKPQDMATGLYYYGARYYNNSIGRFISRDPAGARTQDPQTLDPYAYARCNPLRFTDPTGACFGAWELAEDTVGLFAGILGFWWLQTDDPSGYFLILQSFLTDWAWQAVQDLGPQENLPKLFTDVVIPASLAIAEQILSTAFQDTNSIIGKIFFGFTVALDLTDFEAQVIVSTAFFLINVASQIASGGICPNFIDTPPLTQIFSSLYVGQSHFNGYSVAFWGGKTGIVAAI
jgi:RHS repeat-associated protein